MNISQIKLCNKYISYAGACNGQEFIVNINLISNKHENFLEKSKFKIWRIINNFSC